MMMIVPLVPVPQPIPRVSGTLIAEPGWIVADPNCGTGLGAGNVTGGIGSVTCGACKPEVSTNWNRIALTMTTVPLALTTLPNCTLNGETDGQNPTPSFTGWAIAVADMGLTTADDARAKLG